jgi:putative endonuclease
LSRSRGRAGERLAEAFLTARGLALVARNYTCRMGELDLVMEDHGVIVIVEVRLRRAGSICSPMESVGQRKVRRIVLATRQFLACRPELDDSAVRFDLVAICAADGDNSVQWIRDAFRA